jgi:hypothetical protein
VPASPFQLSPPALAPRLLPCPAQVRQALTEYCILPLGSQFIHERAPYVKSALLYGAEKTGKTLMAQVGRRCIRISIVLDVSG